MAEYVCEMTDDYPGVPYGSDEYSGTVERRERVVRCRDCKFCDVVPDGSTCFCRHFYDKPDWGLPAPYTGSEPAEMLEVSFDGFCAWGERKGDS